MIRIMNMRRALRGEVNVFVVEKAFNIHEFAQGKL
jgi:hypothetical protein